MIDIKKILLECFEQDFQKSIESCAAMRADTAIKSEDIPHKQLVDKLHNTIIKKFQKRKVTG